MTKRYPIDRRTSPHDKATDRLRSLLLKHNAYCASGIADPSDRAEAQQLEKMLDS